jgi:hypothetical protein
MRVITAIYLHVRPELRDEWISGGGVEEAVEEAVPLEQASRGLVHWWHLKRYRDCMGIDMKMSGKDCNGARTGRDSEEDFFARELEKMGWGVGGLAMGLDGDNEAEGDDRQEWEGPYLNEGVAW